MESINYSDFIQSCDSGDLILYTSKKWYSYIIEFLGWSKYSHVSMVIKDPIWISPDLKGLYIFESGAEDVKDVLDGKKVYGVQLVKLEDSLKYYKTLTLIGDQSKNNGVSGKYSRLTNKPINNYFNFIL